MASSVSDGDRPTAPHRHDVVEAGQAKASIALVGKGDHLRLRWPLHQTVGGMLTMKSDMAGAAAVAAAVMAAAELDLPVAVTGYLCLAENMPSGTAQRPSDVVTMRNRSTVEIIDTDAEGRMVLGDGLCLAAEKKPDAIIDIATLTGAQMVALGNLVAGVMANDDSFRDRVVLAGATAGEPSWPMPLPESLRKGLESQTADIAHKADRWGGMLTAGLFLSTFVPGAPHGPSTSPARRSTRAAPLGMAPKGGTGWRVASLVALIEAVRLNDHGSGRTRVRPTPVVRWCLSPTCGGTVAGALVSGPWAWSTLPPSPPRETSAPPWACFFSSASRNLRLTSSLAGCARWCPCGPPPAAPAVAFPQPFTYAAGSSTAFPRPSTDVR